MLAVHHPSVSSLTIRPREALLVLEPVQRHSGLEPLILLPGQCTLGSAEDCTLPLRAQGVRPRHCTTEAERRAFDQERDTWNAEREETTASRAQQEQQLQTQREQLAADREQLDTERREFFADREQTESDSKIPSVESEAPFDSTDRPDQMLEK